MPELAPVMKATPSWGVARYMNVPQVAYGSTCRIRRLYIADKFCRESTMSAQNVVEAIGKTPLIKLRQASKATGCTIYGKAEFMNPGGSIKDRAALAIVSDAVARGTLKPGGLIVEGTAGNTGIGLALVANALSYRTVIVI